jgi:hypothetical protein
MLLGISACVEYNVMVSTNNVKFILFTHLWLILFLGGGLLDGPALEETVVLVSGDTVADPELLPGDGIGTM